MSVGEANIKLTGKIINFLLEKNKTITVMDPKNEMILNKKKLNIEN